MSTHQAIVKGDWVRASAKNGSVVEGQALNDLPVFGYAGLDIAIEGDGGHRQIAIPINVNFWDVEIIRKNNIGRAEKESS